MTDEQIVAEPSAAAVADTHVQFDGWDEKGTPIVTDKIEPKKQETAPAAEPAKEATSENAAESETATPQEKKERKPGEKLSAEERKAQLASEIKALTAEVNGLKAERERSRATEPKPSTPEPVKQAATPKRPNPFNWAGTQEEYDVAVDAWEKHQREQTLQEFQRNEAQRALDRKMQGQLDEARAKYPDADEKLKATLDSFSKVQFPGVIRSMLDDTECFTELIYVLSDPETRNNFIETATKNPGKAVRVLAQMERDIAAASSKSEPPAKSEKPPAELKPRAPKPPSEVGGRGAAPEDELVSAARDPKGFQRFEAEMNRRKFAKSA